MIPKEKPPGFLLRLIRRYKVLQPFLPKSLLAGRGPVRTFFGRRPFVLFVVVTVLVGGALGPFLGKSEMYGKNRAKKREQESQKQTPW